MQELKQALNLAKNKWQISIAIGIAATFFIFLVRFIPTISAYFMSVGLLVAQTQIDEWLDGKSFKDISILRKKIISILLSALVLMPTVILMGSSGGLLQRTDTLLQSLAPAYFLAFICLFFYVAVARSLWIERKENLSIARSLDKSFNESFRGIRKKLPLLLSLTLGIVVAELLWGVGLIVILPICFYAVNFSYRTFTSAK
jgi:hypothetical protein